MNPAAPAACAVGVADRRLAPLLAGVLAAGVSALVFRGDDGMDELTVTTTSTVWSVHDGKVREAALRPAGPRHRADARPHCAAATGCTTRGWHARSLPAPGDRYGTRCC